jgi:hypothetical protein
MVKKSKVKVNAQVKPIAKHTKVDNGETKRSSPILKLGQNNKVEILVLSALELLTKSKTWNPWHHNREIDMTRVDRLVDIQEKKFNEEKKFDFYFNPFVLCHLKDVDDRQMTYLIDGQHRLETLNKLQEKKIWNEVLMNTTCPVMTIQCDAMKDIEYNFLMVNSGTPVPASYYNKKVCEIIDLYLKYLEITFPGLKKKSEKCHRPSYNEKIVREEMSKIQGFRDAVIDGKITNEKILIESTESINTAEKRSFNLKYKGNNTLVKSNTQLKRAKESGFYIGLSKMNEWSLSVVNGALESTGCEAVEGSDDDEFIK